jgi:transcriptional regulator with XRE-family HTH domain
MNIAPLIDELFQMHPKADGTEYSNHEVAKIIGCDASYLGKLRRGVITNPGRDTLISLAKFFGVPITYFFPEMTENLVDADVQVSVALRSAGLDEDERSHIKAIIDIIRGKKKQ